MTLDSGLMNSFFWGNVGLIETGSELVRKEFTYLINSYKQHIRSSRENYLNVIIKFSIHICIFPNGFFSFIFPEIHIFLKIGFTLKS